MEWGVEAIPNEDKVYLRVHKNKQNSAEFQMEPGFFSQQGEDGLSVEWDKYTSPQLTLNRSAIPEDNGVISLNAGLIRGLEMILGVNHDPLPELNNRAHSLIVRIPKIKSLRTKTRYLLAEIAQIELPIPKKT